MAIRATFTVFWSQSYCSYLQKTGQTGEPLRFIWGGHNHNTKYSRMNVKQGDTIYPIMVKARELYLIGRMQVEQLLTVEAFMSLYPEYRQYITNECATEILLGEDGTPLQFNKAISQAVVSQIRYCNRFGERGIKSLRDGKIQFSLGLQGVYRLCPQSALLLSNQLV